MNACAVPAAGLAGIVDRGRCRQYERRDRTDRRCAGQGGLTAMILGNGGADALFQGRPEVSARSSSVCWRRPVPPVRTCRADAWNRSTHASTASPDRAARRGQVPQPQSFVQAPKHGGRMHSQSASRKQQRRVPAVRPVHSPLYRSLFLGIVLGAACPGGKRWMPSGWRGRQHGRLARRCQPSRAGRADRFRQRDVARRRCGGGHRQHLCRAQARPDRHRRQRRLSAAQNMSVAGSMVLGRPGDRDLRLPGLRGSRTGRGKGRGWRDDRANRRQSRGGRGPGRADGSRRHSPSRGPTHRRGQARRAWKWAAT